jgi:hypothetical protein
MPYTWGSTNLKIVPQTYSPPHSSNGLTEIIILPDGSGNPSTVLQQAGRGRKTVSFQGFTTTRAAYMALRDDYVTLTERIFSDGTESLNMIISDLSPATMITEGKYDYSITLMEV